MFSFDLSEAEAGIATWIEATAVERPEDGFDRDELETHLREEYSTFNWLLEPMIERAGFEILAAEYGTVRAYADYVCAKQGR